MVMDMSLGWTFQKFYQPTELRSFIERTLGREAFTAGPGLIFVFRDPLAEQEFLLSRQQRRADLSLNLAARREMAMKAKVEALEPELEPLWSAQELGRWPFVDETPPELAARLEAGAGSLRAKLMLAQAQTLQL